MKIISIIPVFNEEKAIDKIVSRFRKGIVDLILFIDDGSTDSSLDKIKMLSNSDVGGELNIRYISHQKNEGVGAAIRTGIEYAIDNKYDIINVMAGNGKDDPAEIPMLVHPIISDGYDYVQGSRFLEGGRWDNLPLARYIGIKLYSYAWTVLTGKKITDVSNGFRAYKASLFSDKRINIWQEWLSRYELELYIHYKVITLGYKFKEVPVSKIYPLSGKYTKIRPFIDWWRILRPLIYLKLGIKD